MPVITENSEHILRRHLMELRQGQEQRGLAVLQGSRLKPPLQQMLDSTEYRVALLNRAREANITVYISPDHDVAVLFNGTPKENWQAIQDLFQELLSHVNPQEIDHSSLFSVYDLKTQYSHAAAWLEYKCRPQHAMLDENDGAAHEINWNPVHFSHALHARKQREKKLVIVCEDNTAQRHLAYSILRPEYDVLMARHGLEALSLYNNNAPDIMFLDILMPHMDGIAVLEYIMQHDPKAHVVMFSAHSDEHKLRTAIAMGAVGFVSKPFTVDTLMKYAHLPPAA